MAMLLVKNLSKSFGSRKVLENISFSVMPGEIVGLVGPNGAGKTTIMKAILGLMSYQSGSIQIDGQSTKFSNHQVLKEVGALIEYPALYPFMTGMDHLRLLSNSSSRQIDKVIDELGMASYINRRTKGYSLGMKQKLGIGLALINDPKLVILDEPMNGLDPQAIKDLREFIKQRAAAGTTFLISSHILSELEKVADDLVIINHGHIVQQATVEEVLSQDTQLIDLKTSDDHEAAQLIARLGYEVKGEHPLTIVQTKKNQIANLLTVLTESGIEVMDVQHKTGDLEHSLLRMLSK